MPNCDYRASYATLLFRSYFGSKADILDYSRFRDARTFRRNWLDAFSKPVIFELFALWPPDGISLRALYSRKWLECPYGRNRYVAMKHGEQNQSMHLILASVVVAINGTFHPQKDIYSNPCNGPTLLQELSLRYCPLGPARYETNCPTNPS